MLQFDSLSDQITYLRTRELASLVIAAAALGYALWNIRAWRRKRIIVRPSVEPTLSTALTSTEKWIQAGVIAVYVGVAAAVVYRWPGIITFAIRTPPR